MSVSNRLLQLLEKLSRRGDLVIAVLMLVAVIMMLIPLPTFLVDMFISFNIAISVLVLLVCLYVDHPLDFSSLPSVILVSTLFRLAITITTTRLILLQANAGDIITAFGSFVVGGSIAVGLVVFFIITIAQFMVVAKGAERVAEVAARFTLDALPGKQMSIDAELRSGDIDQAEARRLRHQLERESQLFGAMDGAMKFVKGDVIAGIVIIFVNLIGGFTVGMLQHGMSAGEAASTYSLLSVGDGLVAQIPALLVAVAAGIMVTRVASVDGQGDLGRQITGQLVRDSRVLALAAAIMIGLSIVPGFPTIVFLLLGALLAAGAYAIHRRAAEAADDKAVKSIGHRQAALTAAPSTAGQLSSRILVRLGPGLGKSVTDQEFREQAERIRHDVFGDLGIEIPAIGLHIDSALGLQNIRIDLEGAPVLDADIPASRLLVESDVANLDLLDIAYEEGATVARLKQTIWVEARHAAALQGAGIGFLAPVQIIGRWIEYALRLYAGHFVGIQETHRLLSGLQPDYADLVKQTQETVPLQKIAEVLRRLVTENVPINNLRPVLEAIAEWGQRESDVVVLTELVRTALKRQISFRAADRNNVIAAYVLQWSAEQALRTAAQATQAGTFLNLSDEDAHIIVGQIEQALAKSSVSVAPVVLTSMDVRRHMRQFLLHNGIELPVLSFEEIASEFNVQPLAAISGPQVTPGGSRTPASLSDAQAEPG